MKIAKPPVVQKEKGATKALDVARKMGRTHIVGGVEVPKPRDSAGQLTIPEARAVGDAASAA